MSRSNVFVSVDNGNRRVRVGGGYGRGASRAYVDINTDNATRSNCNVVVTASVEGDRSLNGKPTKKCSCGHKWANGVLRVRSENGIFIKDVTTEATESVWTGDKCPKCGEDRKGQDTRVSKFKIETPRQDDGHCHVFVNGTPLSELSRLEDQDIIDQVRRRNLYPQIVKALFSLNPLDEEVPAELVGVP